MTYLPDTKFLMLNPDKSGWSAMDHHVRFVVGITHDCAFEYLWGRKECVKKYSKIARGIYEVLVYLKATAGVEEESSEVHPAKL